MRLAVVYCLAAMLGYALEISITDWKLSGVSPRLLTLCYSLGVALLAGISLLGNSGELTAPTAGQWPFVALMVLASFVAGWAHFAALHHGAGAVLLAMVYCVMPVCASLLMFAFRGETPNPRMLLAWGFATAALYLASTAKTE